MLSSLSDSVAPNLGDVCDAREQSVRDAVFVVCRIQKRNLEE
jgi:hypothetical protein